MQNFEGGNTSWDNESNSDWDPHQRQGKSDFTLIFINWSRNCNNRVKFYLPFSKHQTEEEWREVFLVTAAVYAVGALLYGLLASGEKQVRDTTSFEFDHVS